MQASPFYYLPDLWPTDEDGREVYDVLLEEIKPDLQRGTIMLGGRLCQEARPTTMYSQVAAVMKYSGRVLQPKRPKKNGYIERLLDIVRTQEFRDLLCEEHAEIATQIPIFNAVFVNWYRPPSECEGDHMDNVGPHSDDVSELDSEVIFSLTFCQSGGERLFTFFDKQANEREYWKQELKNGDGLLMMQGCQRRFKHSVSSRKTHLDRTKITGGRINLTFRLMKLSPK